MAEGAQPLGVESRTCFETPQEPILRLLGVGSRLCALLLLAAPSRAQDVTPSATPVRERVTLNVDAAVVKKLAAVRDYIEEGQWTEALDVVQQFSGEETASLVPVAPGMYANVEFYINGLLAGLPAAGLARYRERVDPQARRWLEAARSGGDDKPLRDILRYAFASSAGDEALWLLGERAWERADLVEARSCWQRMLPRQAKSPDGPAFDGLRFPDTQFDPAQVQARIILCSIMEGDRSKAKEEIRDFRRKYSASNGALAGRHGPLADILDDLAAQVLHWDFHGRDSGTTTFALNARRNGILPDAIDVGSVQWSVPLAGQPASAFPLQPAFGDAGVLSYFPVVSNGVILVNDADHVLAFDVKSGKPAWPVDNSDNAVIYPAVPDERLPAPSLPSSGIPRFTMTVDEGRLYAKMGSPVTARSTRELRELPSQLICLDLAHGEGKLLWMARAAEIDPAGTAWAFEGSPVVAGGRAYVALRRSRPETQMNVACFDAEGGALLWNRMLCATASPVDDEFNYMSHQLLTLRGNSVYFSTELGAVAALDAEDGRLRWVATYESENPPSLAALSSPTRYGLLPCLIQRDTLVAAPNDSRYLMAFDAETGRLKWRWEMPQREAASRDRIRHLLGVAQGNVIASGDSLWALNLDTGRVAWRIQTADPEMYGYGRGVLAGDVIYWPTREEIVVVQQATGQILRRIAIRAIHGEPGGNLTIAEGLLIIAQPDRLVAFSEYARQKSEPVRNVTLLDHCVAFPWHLHIAGAVSVTYDVDSRSSK